MRVKIKAKTATELCQIEDSSLNKATKVSEIHIKKQKVIVINSKNREVPLMTPVFSGNSFRAKLRRASFGLLLEKGIEKGFNVDTAVDFHLSNAGGGGQYQTQAFDIEDKARELNPILSVFGTSLALSGRIKTPNLMPYKNIEDGVKEYYFGETEDGSVYSSIKFSDSFYKKDDMLDRNGNAKYLAPELLKKWQEEVAENQADVAKGRNSESEKKVKKESIRATLAREFVVRGTHFYTALSEMPTTKMTPIERGMVYKALEAVVLENLGSNVARDFGLMEYDIEFADGSTLATSVDEYLVPTITKKDFKEEVMADISAFEEWLEKDFSEEAFNLSTLLTRKE